MARINILALLLGCLFSCLVDSKEKDKPYVGMRKFLSRPDIECASWKVKIYDETALAPGYWFVAPYEKNGYKKPGGSWIGPHIYDGNGELIWSGSHLFNRINVMDFGIMNVAGEEFLSMSYAVEGSGYLLDHGYKVNRTVFEGVTGSSYNMHDFHTVDDGNRFLYLQRNTTQASAEIAKQDLGYDGECHVTYPAFEERDVETGEIVFNWDATGNIPLSDSTMDFAPVEKRCGSRGAWDFLHSNAVDKFPDGNYLLSTRHSDTIYKISKDDGSIIWRLHGHGGERSDFEMGNLNFSRQHHARFREQNETHTIISFLDNAVGADPQPATTQWSRGLMVALREDLMTAEIIASYDEPHGGHAWRRGSYQILPNGNAFMGWSEQGLQSEHTPDGRLLMEAELVERRLGTYRAFKFPFVANLDYPPDIYSNASSVANKTTTSVYMTWNGATEVASWTLYKTNKSGSRSLKLNTVQRSGFETAIHHDGYCKYVFVKAKDRNGKTLRRSDIIETETTDGVSEEATGEEQLWLDGDSDEQSWTDDLADNSTALFLGGLVCGAIIVLPCFFVPKGKLQWWRKRQGPKYVRVATADAAEFDETQLDDLSHSRHRARDEDGDFSKARHKDADDSDTGY